MTMQEVLARWLVAEGLAEEKDGFGHASGEKVAERLLATFDIRIKTRGQQPVSGLREALADLLYNQPRGYTATPEGVFRLLTDPDHEAAVRELLGEEMGSG